MQVSELRPSEAVFLDTERLEEICDRLGYHGGETAICATMEDLATLLHLAGKVWRADQTDQLELTARRIVGAAEQIGMAGLGRVAGDVLGLCWSGNEAALAATVARMRRVGEQSLLAIWDRQDQML